MYVHIYIYMHAYVYVDDYEHMCFHDCVYTYTQKVYREQNQKIFSSKYPSPSCYMSLP